MKKITCFFVCFSVLFSNLMAQEYRNGIGVHFSGIDFYGPQTGNYFLQDKMNKSSLKTEKKLFWDPSIRASYWHCFTNHLDLNAGLNIAALQYPASDKDSNFIAAKLGSNLLKNQIPYVALDAKLNYNLLNKFSYLVSPYITAGLRASFRESENGIDIPAGLGANINLGKGVFVNVESNYGMALSKVNQSHLTHQIGLVYWWKSSKKVKEPEIKLPPPPIVKDSDNDGIIDAEDACPTLPGKKDMKGCPDRDNDGVADGDDVCPDAKGLKQFNGCPDMDNDGIVDNKDNCPTVAGLARYQGCPIPDRDHDGFNDEVDKCADIASAVNEGCPEVKQADKQKIEMAAQGINFETGSAAIKKSSFANLDKIVDILKAEPTYLLDIEGHTDNVGTSEKNLELSQKRADACMNYLIANGIDQTRISSIGYGDTKPIGDNETAEGRAKNRRTEFLIRSY